MLPALKRPHGEYFKMFYGDTAMFGSSSAFPTGMDYFGPDHVVFSTDAPFAPVAETFESLKTAGTGSRCEEKTVFRAMPKS